MTEAGALYCWGENDSGQLGTTSPACTLPRAGERGTHAERHMSVEHSWLEWGERDPYYAVLTSERFRRDRLTPAELQEFYAFGGQPVARMLEVIRTHIRRDFSPLSALDFGCGAGRVAIPLSAHASATAVDISPGMLREARANSAVRGAGDIRFSTKLECGPYDLVHSALVFQHIPVETGLPLTRQLLALVSDEGVAVLHYVCGDSNSVRSRMSRVTQRVPVLRHVLNQWQGRRFGDPPMRMYAYPSYRLLMLFREVGFSRLLVECSESSSDGLTFYLWR